MSLGPSLSFHEEKFPSGGSSYKNSPLLWVCFSFLLLHKHLLDLRPTPNQEVFMALTLASTKTTFPKKLMLTDSIGLSFMESFIIPPRIPSPSLGASFHLIWKSFFPRLDSQQSKPFGHHQNPKQLSQVKRRHWLFCKAWHPPPLTPLLFFLEGAKNPRTQISP